MRPRSMYVKMNVIELSKADNRSLRQSQHLELSLNPFLNRSMPGFLTGFFPTTFICDAADEGPSAAAKTTSPVGFFIRG